MLTEVEPRAKAIELAVVVPCFNERDNVPILVEKLHAALRDIEWEVIFVDDDSPDGTANAAWALAATNRRVRCIQRIGRRGLATAVVEGMLATSAPYLAVIDGDLQHDERLLPDMLRALKNENLDLVVGSRYVKGGGIGEWDRSRAAMSTLATRLARLVVHQPLSDPMSGFFAMTRPALERCGPRIVRTGFQSSVGSVRLDVRAVPLSRTALHLPRSPARTKQARQFCRLGVPDAPDRQAHRMVDSGAASSCSPQSAPPVCLFIS